MISGKKISQLLLTVVLAANLGACGFIADEVKDGVKEANDAIIKANEALYFEAQSAQFDSLDPPANEGAAVDAAAKLHSLITKADERQLVRVSAPLRLRLAVLYTAQDKDNLASALIQQAESSGGLTNDRDTAVAEVWPSFINLKAILSNSAEPSASDVSSATSAQRQLYAKAEPLKDEPENIEVHAWLIRQAAIAVDVTASRLVDSRLLAHLDSEVSSFIGAMSSDEKDIYILFQCEGNPTNSGQQYASLLSQMALAVRLDGVFDNFSKHYQTAGSDKLDNEDKRCAAVKS